MDNNYFFFASFSGVNFSDNPRALFNILVKKFPEATYVIFVKDKNVQQKLNNEYLGVRFLFITEKRFKFLFGLAKSKYWFVNYDFPIWLKPKKNGKYIQTWHGTPLKHIASDMKLDIPEKKIWAKESNSWDYFISNSAHDNWIYKSAFNLDENKIIALGLPRNDILSDQEKVKYTCIKVKEKLNINNGKMNVLYAPTFRDGEHKYELNLDLKRLNKVVGAKYNILLRLHPNVRESFETDYFNLFSSIIDCSHYEDIQELYIVSDVLITDYSSVFFDYSILGRPIVFYPYDFDKYKNSMRGFYYDYKKFVPGQIVKSENELIETLESLNNLDKYELESERAYKFSKIHNANTDISTGEKILAKIMN
ncbi:CDP-glycerol glycerophosphotransferase family protein [Loigolactobacillus coryniformis]|uniref:CDP-glycerol glycerophosphotransferase family protein n=1 Tax=Loigolactobacillus coryniformis TaxID=1610 RepID=UPI001C5FEB52|nr:CDP-glycerol glycerophosphotransferase family protein [Loigolactobacillus coryniformis subsp. torquens]